MTSKSRLTIAVLFVTLAILALNNIVYYYSTKKLLIDDLQEKMESVAQQVRISIDHADVNKDYVDLLMAENLRSASIAIQYALDPDVEAVTNEQLVQLRDQLGLANITLLKRIPGDIIGYRSSDPEEIGMTTNTWTWWYDSFNELLDLKPVTTDKGETMPNYWSGPFEISTTNPNNIEKWGYYYDGTTNYLIDPYISNDFMDRFDNEAGPQSVVDKLIAANEFLKEITVFNHEDFGTTPKVSVNSKNETWVHFERRPILYGSYQFRDDQTDVEYVRKAMETDTIQSRLATINGTQVYKSYVPIKNTSISAVIGIVSDYSIIQDKLNGQFRYLALVVIAVTILSIAIAAIVLRFVRKYKDRAVQATQETYIHEVNELFTAIRGQRHDFLNQVQTIQMMASLGKTEELRKYTSELAGDIRVISDIIQIGNPAVASLVQSKIVAASNKKIDLSYEISGLDDVKLGVKSVDIVRIIGNLIDNAFDEVQCLDESDRRVLLTIHAVDGYLQIKVNNPGRFIPPEQLEQLFQPGYSTRDDGMHHGLGLAVVKERTTYNRGTVHANSSVMDGITFEVKLPLA